MHLPGFIENAGVPREYWTYSNEKEIGGFKKRSGNTNNRSICLSIFRNSWLYNVLVMYLDPHRHIPKAFEYQIVDIFPITNEFRESCNISSTIVPDTLQFGDKLSRLTANYLDVRPGTMIRVVTGSYGCVRNVVGLRTLEKYFAVVVIQIATLQGETLTIEDRLETFQDSDIVARIECLRTRDNNHIICKEIETLFWPKGLHQILAKLSKCNGDIVVWGYSWVVVEKRQMIFFSHFSKSFREN
jgi:hypothetical protein